MNLVLFLHSTIISLAFIYFVFINYQEFRFSKDVKLKFLLIFVIALFINFFYLKSYPFVAVGDEIRDGALDSARIASSQIKNIFGYGSYNAHGLIIPAFNSNFYKVFGNSVLSYRIPTAIIGTIDIILLFFIITKLVGSIAGFWAALLLTCLPLHIFYSRTETVVIFSSLITTTLLYFSYRTIKNKKDFLYLALLIGFSFNFHASVKTVAILLLPLLLFKIISFRKILKIISSLTITILVIIIGFGPRLMYTTPEIFFNLSRLDRTSINFTSLFSKYLESLKVIVSSPTTSHYFDHQPLLTIPLFLLFLIGLVFLFKKEKKLFFLLIYLALAIPFTNSAITDMINADHRLMPLLPIISFVIGFCISYITKIKSKLFKQVFVSIIFIYLVKIVFNFFYYQEANINDYNNWREPKDYLSMHLIYLIQKNNFPNDITIYTSPYNATNYNYLHYQEQYKFFLPDKNIIFLGAENLDNYSVRILTNETFSLTVDCLDLKNRFYCPLNDPGKFTIYY